MIKAAKMTARFLATVAGFLACTASLQTQVGGNAGFGQNGGRAKAEQSEHSLRVLAKDDQPPSPTSTFLEASVLMNVKADEIS